MLWFCQKTKITNIFFMNHKNHPKKSYKNPQKSNKIIPKELIITLLLIGLTKYPFNKRIFTPIETLLLNKFYDRFNKSLFGSLTLLIVLLWISNYFFSSCDLTEGIFLLFFLILMLYTFRSLFLFKNSHK